MDIEFFNKSLQYRISQVDPIIEAIIKREELRQDNELQFIASENYVSPAVLYAQGSILTNKYAEGYPAKRYYGGCQIVDEAENIAIERAKLLFDANFANVQPHSGSQANQSVFMALLQPGDTILGMSLDAGGHLTHGAKVNQSGKWFNAITYGVRELDGAIDYEKIMMLAEIHKPKLIIAGCSAYPRFLNFPRFKEIADQVGAYLMVDMAHFAGQVAAKLYQNPLSYAHVVTTTTHKTLRGPRGGMVLTNHEDIAKKINAAVFPGIQGGPLMHIIAAKAVAFAEALMPEYVLYITQVLKNAQTLANIMRARGITLYTGGTDCHLLLADLSKLGITGKDAEDVLCKVGLVCNKNSIPFDVHPPKITSGIRLGTPAVTTRGLNTEDIELIAHKICDILEALTEQEEELEEITREVQGIVQAICRRYPLLRS